MSDASSRRVILRPYCFRTKRNPSVQASIKPEEEEEEEETKRRSSFVVMEGVYQCKWRFPTAWMAWHPVCLALYEDGSAIWYFPGMASCLAWYEDGGTI